MKKLSFLFILLLAFAGTLSAKTFTVFILCGQSNSLGAIKGNPADEEKMKPEPKMLFWHKNFGGYCRGPKSTEWGKIEPQKEAQIVMGPEYGFGQMLQKKANKKYPPATTGILKASRDGGGNGNWLKPGDENSCPPRSDDYLGYNNLISAAQESFAALEKKGFDRVEVAALLYLQGESNSGKEVPEAGTRFKKFYNNLKNDLAKLKIKGLKISTAKMVAIIGEPATFWDKETEFEGTTTSKELKKIAEANKKIFVYVPTRDLPKIKKGDNMGVHYEGNSQIKIGHRFAEAYLNLTK